MFPAARHPKAPSLQTAETKWLSEIQVMAPDIME